jgi:hypothetical protein
MQQGRHHARVRLCGMRVIADVRRIDGTGMLVVLLHLHCCWPIANHHHASSRHRAR